MASDAARKDARERSLGGAALRLLALLALAAVVIRTRAVPAAARVGDAAGARAERVRALEHELLELAARQRAVDAELAAAAPAAGGGAARGAAAGKRNRGRRRRRRRGAPGDALRDDGDAAPGARRPTRSSPRTAARRRGATRARRASSGTTGPTRRPRAGADLAPARPRARARASGAAPRSADSGHGRAAERHALHVGDARPARHTRAPRGPRARGVRVVAVHVEGGDLRHQQPGEPRRAAPPLLRRVPPGAAPAPRHLVGGPGDARPRPLLGLALRRRAGPRPDRPAGPAGRAALAPPEPAARENRGRALPRRGDVAARRLQRGGSPTSAGATAATTPRPRRWSSRILGAAAARAQRGAAGAVQGPGRVLGRDVAALAAACRDLAAARVRRRPAVPPASPHGGWARARPVVPC